MAQIKLSTRGDFKGKWIHYGTCILGMLLLIQVTPIMAGSVSGGTVIELKTKFPEAIFDTAASYDDHDSIYIFGGDKIGRNNSAAIYKFSISTESLEIVANFPRSIYGGTAIKDKFGDVWYFGGSEDGKPGYTTNVWKFNPTTSTITNVTSTGLVYLAKGFWDKRTDTAYFFGGNVQPDTYKIFSEANLTVTQVKEGYPQIMQLAFTCTPANDTIAYITTPLMSQPYSAATIYKFDATNRSFTDLETTLPIYTQNGLAFWNDDSQALYVFSGFNSTSGNDAVQFIPSTRKTTALTFVNYPSGLYSASGVYVQSLKRFYIFGGIQIGPQFKYGYFRNQIVYVQLGDIDAGSHGEDIKEQVGLNHTHHGHAHEKDYNDGVKGQDKDGHASSIAIQHRCLQILIVLLFTIIM